MNAPRQTITHVPIELLRAHPANIRDDLGDLTEMALSIKEHGILQPLTATEDPGHPGKLLLLAGHRRLGGATLAGLKALPVVIRHGVANEDDQLVLMLVENTHRRDLNPVERAEAYGALRNRGLTISEIARRTGTLASTVSYYLNLLMLDPVERQEVREGTRNSTEAIATVRDARQEARAQAGAPLRGRPKAASASWFGPTHRLASTVRAICNHGAAKVGQCGCGPCWERAIIAEHQGEDLQPAAKYDESAVLRRLNGDHSAHLRKADRVEVVRRAQARGMSYLDIERLTGITKVERYVIADGRVA